MEPPWGRPASRWPVRAGAVVVFATGVALRLVYAIPDYRYAAEADCAMTGIVALKILGGDLRIFLSGVRLGAFESYLTAGWFALFGVSHVGLSIGPIVASSLTLVFFGLFAREMLGQRLAILALLFLALPSPAYVFWTSLPTTYSQTMLFASAALWLSARIVRTGEGGRWALGFGLAAGLGWWNCLLTLAVSMPAFLWLVLRRPDVAGRARFLACCLAGFLLGALPWVAFNVRYPLASFRDNFAVRPATSIVGNTRYFVGYDLPELAVAADPTDGRTRGPVGFAWLRALVSAVYLGAAATFLTSVVRALARWIARGRLVRSDSDPEILLALVVLAAFVLDVFSEPGSTRGLTVRYVLPVMFAIVVALARLCQFISRRSRPVAIGIAAVVLVFNLSSYFWPWTASRREWRRREGEATRLLAVLNEHRVAYVVGDYWDAYPVNLSSRLKIKGIPYRPEADMYRFEAELGSRPRPTAVISSDLSSLRRVASKAGLTGQLIEVGPTAHLFLPEPNPPSPLPPSGFVATVRNAFLSLDPVF